MKPYYEEKNIKLYCGDYREVLPSLEPNSTNLLLTDPPYGTTCIEWDKKVDWMLFWQIVERLCKRHANKVLFSAGHFVNELINSNRKEYRYDLIWAKSMPTGFLDAKRRPLRTHENILIFTAFYRKSVYHPQMVVGKMHTRGHSGTKAVHYSTGRKTESTRSNKYYPRSVLFFSNTRAGGRSLHPTQKPLDLMLWLIRTYSNVNHLVVDTFVGSGTTLLAAQKTNRRAIGIEREEKYCEIAAKRLTGQIPF